MYLGWSYPVEWAVYSSSFVLNFDCSSSAFKFLIKFGQFTGPSSSSFQTRSSYLLVFVLYWLPSIPLENVLSVFSVNYLPCLWERCFWFILKTGFFSFPFFASFTHTGWSPPQFLHLGFFLYFSEWSRFLSSRFPQILLSLDETV